jgi:hypothetical protein
MRGHEPIIQARLQGRVLAWVLVNVGSAQQGFLPRRPVLAAVMGLSLDRLNTQLDRLGPYLYEIHKRPPPRLFAGLHSPGAHSGRSYA